jgi:hypothetical protein
MSKCTAADVKQHDWALSIATVHNIRHAVAVIADLELPDDVQAVQPAAVSSGDVQPACCSFG